MGTMAEVLVVILLLTFGAWESTAQDTGRDVRVIQTAQAGQYLQDMGTIRLDYGIKPVPTSQDSISVDANTRYQTILGFGTSFTESAAYSFSKASAAGQQEIIDAYWGVNSNNSIRFTLGRIPMAACDYSLTIHSYDDTAGDTDLNDFSIAYDEKLILPFLKQAYKASNGKLKLIAAPWSPPGWMKTNGNMKGGGNLQTKYYQTMANYVSKFIDAYNQSGVPIWGVTPQNEPEYGPANYPGCVYNPQTEADYIKTALGPTLAQKNPSVNILGFDHNRDSVYTWAQVFYNDPEVTKYLWGIAFHWYASQPYFDHVQSTHNLNPGKHLLLTEAAECNAGQQDWGKGEDFGYDIINDLNVWAEGFIQWNAVLIDNGQGMWGPFEYNENGVNTCQSPIVILNGQVVKKPAYYYIGQISRYLPPGSVRVGTMTNFKSQNLYATVFLDPSSNIVIVIMNSNGWAIDLNITDNGRTMAPKIPAHGIVTLSYQSWSNY